MDARYDQAADLLTAGDAAGYQALRAAAPELDWRGHDRRAALLAGQTAAELGPDPYFVEMTAPAKVPMSNEEYRQWRREHGRVFAEAAEAFNRAPARRPRKAA